jgi:hypothetical protein
MHRARDFETCRYAARVARQRTRWEQDNEAPVNVAAFVAIAVVAILLVGLGVLLALT